MKFIIGLGVMLLALVSCSEPQDGAASQYRNDYQLGHYTSSEKGYYSNSFWIEGPQGVILIGSQFLPSSVNEAVDIAESRSGKKVVLAIVLHATPDQFNGVQALRARGIKVVSSKPVVAQIPAMHNKTWPIFSQRFKGDYPDALVLPEAAWEQTTEFEAAGLKLKAYVIRQGLSQSHVLIEFDGHLFVGGLVSHKAHAWPDSSGRTDHWLERLAEIGKFAKPQVIHPGRGYAMNGVHLLDQQAAYLNGLQQAVAASYSGGDISELDKQDIIQRMVKLYPDYAFASFLKYNVVAEWKRLRKKDHEMM